MYIYENNKRKSNCKQKAKKEKKNKFSEKKHSNKRRNKRWNRTHIAYMLETDTNICASVNTKVYWFGNKIFIKNAYIIFTFFFSSHSSVDTHTHTHI